MWLMGVGEEKDIFDEMSLILLMYNNISEWN